MQHELKPRTIEKIQKAANGQNVCLENDSIQAAYNQFYSELTSVYKQENPNVSQDSMDNTMEEYFSDLVCTLYDNTLPFYPAKVWLSERDNFKMQLEALRNLSDQQIDESSKKNLSSQSSVTANGLKAFRNSLKKEGAIEQALLDMGYGQGVTSIAETNRTHRKIATMTEALGFEKTRVENIDKVRQSLQHHFNTFGGIEAKGKPVFYSGNVYAKKGASANGHQLLANPVVEATANFIGSSQAKALKISNNDWPRAGLFWHAVSAEYASTAKPENEIKVFVPAGMQNSSVFWDTELTQLRQNGCHNINTYCLSEAMQEELDFDLYCIEVINDEIREIEGKIKNIDCQLSNVQSSDSKVLLLESKKDYENELEKLHKEKQKDEEKVVLKLQSRDSWIINPVSGSNIVADSKKQSISIEKVKQFAGRWRSSIQMIKESENDSLDTEEQSLLSCAMSVSMNVSMNGSLDGSLDDSAESEKQNRAAYKALSTGLAENMRQKNYESTSQGLRFFTVVKEAIANKDRFKSGHEIELGLRKS